MGGCQASDRPRSKLFADTAQPRARALQRKRVETATRFFAAIRTTLAAAQVPYENGFFAGGQVASSKDVVSPAGNSVILPIRP